MYTCTTLHLWLSVCLSTVDDLDDQVQSPQRKDESLRVCLYRGAVVPAGFMAVNYPVVYECTLQLRCSCSSLQDCKANQLISVCQSALIRRCSFISFSDLQQFRSIVAVRSRPACLQLEALETLKLMSLSSADLGGLRAEQPADTLVMALPRA